MTNILHFMVFSVLILIFKPTGAFLQSGLELGGKLKWRDVHCRESLEYYPSDNICCLNCPAGTRLISPCTAAGEKGRCEECDDGTYIEHTNSLKQCFKCTQCRSDQEIVRLCTHTHNTECQCKSGRFCAPDQACEVCKRCSICEKDEEVTRNCTSTTNRECKKIQPKSGSASGKTSVILLSLFAIVAVFVLAIAVYVMTHRTSKDSGRNVLDCLKPERHDITSCPADEGKNGEPQTLSCSGLILSRPLVRAKPSVHVEDERKVLCESLNSSASNSQHSLTGLPSYAFPASSPRTSPTAPRQQPDRRDEKFPKLVAVNGEESLRKCFDYFEDIDIDHHKRFFRHLGVNDNMMKKKEHLPYEDKIHELLNIWIEAKGKEASLNDLLKVLLDLDQRRTAETVKENAVHDGHYFCQE